MRMISQRLISPARIRATLLGCALVAGCSAVTVGPPATGAAAVPPAGPRRSPRRRPHYLALAEQGVSAAQTQWADPRQHWYDETLHDPARYPLATIWDIVPLFQSLDAIAIAAAEPGEPERGAHVRQRRRALPRSWAAAGAGIRALPGRSRSQRRDVVRRQRLVGSGIRQRLSRHRLHSATSPTPQRALTYIARAGWDPQAGGIWWNTTHPYKAGEALASGTLLATLLYLTTHSASDLAEANMFLAWGNTTGFSAGDGLYAKSDSSRVPEDYIEAPLIFAQQQLCAATGVQADCSRAEALTDTSLQRFGPDLDFGPQYDAIYLQWMLALYGADHDPRLYDLAASNAAVAAERGTRCERPVPALVDRRSAQPGVAAPNMLQTQAATTSVFAWLAVYPPPAEASTAATRRPQDRSAGARR